MLFISEEIVEGLDVDIEKRGSTSLCARLLRVSCGEMSSLSVWDDSGVLNRVIGVAIGVTSLPCRAKLGPDALVPDVSLLFTGVTSADEKAPLLFFEEVAVLSELAFPVDQSLPVPLESCLSKDSSARRARVCDFLYR